MSRRTFRSSLLSSILCLGLAPLALAGGEIGVFVGEKEYDLDLDATNEVLKPFEEQDEVGLLFAFTGKDWPVSLAVDLLQTDERVSVSAFGTGGSVFSSLDVEVQEIDVGVRKYFRSKIQPYLGGGIAVANVDVKLTSTLIAGPLSLTQNEQEDDRTFGYWINAGVAFRLGRRFNLGLDGRFSDAEAEIDNENLDIGGSHIGAFLGFSWGERP